MIPQLNIYILNRSDLVIKSFTPCYVYEINRDYLVNEKSSFSIPGGSYTAEQGDFLVAKTFNDKFTTEGIKPLYFGVIDSFSNDAIITCDLYNIVNFSFPATRKTGGVSGGGFGGHINNLLNYYLDSSKLVSKITWTVDDSAKVAYSYQPSDPPTITNMVDYLINGFKKYNITWEVDSISYNSDNSLNVSTIIKKITDRIQLKNNTYSFVNWDVYENDTGRSLENELLIVDKASTDMENPIVLDTYYITRDGTITQAINDNVWKPTKTKIYIYDQTAIDKPTYLEVAQSELSASKYAHEIEFDLVKDKNLITLEDLKIGLQVYIVHSDTIYDSVLTGYIISSNNNFIHLKFGHTRSTLRQILPDNTA
jgi:hypothetical protein